MGSSGKAGASQSFVGYNTIGASQETMVRGTYLKQIVLARQAAVLTVDGYVTPANANSALYIGSVFSDISGAPGIVLTGPSAISNDVPSAMFSTLGANATPRWIACPVGIFLVAGTYWIGFGQYYNQGGTASTLAYDTGTDKKQIVARVDDTSVTAAQATVQKFSIRASLLLL